MDVFEILVVASPEPYAQTVVFFQSWKFFFFYFFYEYFFVSVNIGPYGSENFKKYSSYTSQPKVLKLVLNPPQWASQNYAWDFWNFEFSIFNDFFFESFNSPL